MKEFDVVIIGGGMVGAAMALNLSRLPLRVCLVERSPIMAFDENAEHNLRVSAINLGSQKMFEDLGVWSAIIAKRACVYRKLSVWEQSDARVDFSAEQINQAHLGHIIENHVIQESLWQGLIDTDVQRLNPVTEVTIVSTPSSSASDSATGSSTLMVDGESISAKLLIAADGAQSATRTALGIGVTGWQYQQAAMLINIKTDFSQQDITWQKFTASGPKAFLPLSGQRGSLVWYDDISRIKTLANYSPEALLETIRTTYKDLPGDFSILNFAYFPLTRQHANTYVKSGAALIGDAAHSINPLAGQGVNLGFRDVMALTDCIRVALENGRDFASLDSLRRYEQARRKDNKVMMTAMDAIYSGFASDNSLVRFARNRAFGLFEQVAPLKKLFLQYAVGQSR